MGEGGGGGGCCASSAMYDAYFGSGDDDCIAWQTIWEKAVGDRLVVWSFVSVDGWETDAVVIVLGEAIVVSMEERARQAWDMMAGKGRRCGCSGFMEQIYLLSLSDGRSID